MENKEGIKRMYNNFLEYENNGLTYLLHKFRADTHDNEFNRALIDFRKSKEILDKKLEVFREQLEEGKFDEFLD